MKHHRYHPGFQFVVEPESFNKYTDRELLQYCLGATMYMPGFKDFAPKKRCWRRRKISTSCWTP